MISGLMRVKIRSTFRTPDVESRTFTDSPQVSGDMQARRHSPWWHLAFDVPIGFTLVAVILLFEFGILPSHRAGFYCKDPALSFDFTGDTVSFGTIVSSIILLPLILVFAMEAVLHRPQEYPLKTSRFAASGRLAGVWYGKYLYGAIFNLFIVEVMKIIIGNPRPTFFSICNPDTAKTCNGTEYVPSFQCQQTKFSSWFLLDSSKSFPSGHTSLSINAAIFMAWYMQRRGFSWHNRSWLAVPALQLLAIAYAAWCSLTRITDHRHHWWDVLAGFVVGLATGLYTIVILCKNFKCATSPSSSDISSSDEGNHQSVRRLLPSGPHTTHMTVP